MISSLSLSAIRLLLGLMFIVNTTALTVFTLDNLSKAKSVRANKTVILVLVVNIFVNALLFFAVS